MALHRSILASEVLLFMMTLLLIVPIESRSNVSVVDTAGQNRYSTDVEAVESALLGTAKRDVQDEFNSTDHGFNLNVNKVNTSALQPLPQAGAAFKLAMQWPYSLCNPNYRRCRALTEPRSFTIHGLWPDPQPNPCRGLPFDMNKIRHNHFLIAQLYIWWSNVLGRAKYRYFHADNERFWKHEWDFHGACSGFQQSDYFMRLATYPRYFRNKYDVEVAIRQGQGYTQIDESDLLIILDNLFVRKVGLKCNQDALQRTQLQEIHLYHRFDSRTGNLILEDIPSYNRRGCGGGMIQFP